MIQRSLRPNSFDEFIGQEKIKKSLRVFIKAARKKHRPLDHILFYGDAGCGKTTLSEIIAKEMLGSKKLIISSGATLKKPVDIILLLNSLTEGSILFIDEIHALSKQSKLNEVLYPAMEDFKIDYTIGEGENTKSESIKLPPFTLIGATTNISQLTPPLRSRFRNIFRLIPYTHEEMCEMIRLSAQRLEIKIDEQAVNIIADASRYVPRLANNILKSVDDFIIADDGKVITKRIVLKAINEFGVKPNGLTDPEVRLLRIMVERFKNTPIGLNTMAQLTNEEKNTIADIYEPFLIQSGFLLRTPKGRIVTSKLIKYLKEAK